MKISDNIDKFYHKFGELEPKTSRRIKALYDQGVRYLCCEIFAIKYQADQGNPLVKIANRYRNFEEQYKDSYENGYISKNTTDSWCNKKNPPNLGNLKTPLWPLALGILRDLYMGREEKLEDIDNSMKSHFISNASIDALIEYMKTGNDGCLEHFEKYFSIEKNESNNRFSSSGAKNNNSDLEGFGFDLIKTVKRFKSLQSFFSELTAIPPLNAFCCSENGNNTNKRRAIPVQQVLQAFHDYLFQNSQDDILDPSTKLCEIFELFEEMISDEDVYDFDIDFSFFSSLKYLVMWLLALNASKIHKQLGFALEDFPKVQNYSVMDIEAGLAVLNGTNCSFKCGDDEQVLVPENAINTTLLAAGSWESGATKDAKVSFMIDQLASEFKKGRQDYRSQFDASNPKSVASRQALNSLKVNIKNRMRKGENVYFYIDTSQVNSDQIKLFKACNDLLSAGVLIPLNTPFVHLPEDFHTSIEKQEFIFSGDLGDQLLSLLQEIEQLKASEKIA